MGMVFVSNASRFGLFIARRRHPPGSVACLSPEVWWFVPRGLVVCPQRSGGAVLSLFHLETFTSRLYVARVPRFFLFFFFGKGTTRWAPS